MCGIFASSDIQKLKELHKLNSYRGALSYSICGFKLYNEQAVKSPVIPTTMFSSEGDLPDTIIDDVLFNPGTYAVAHVQAPTTQSGGRHPATVAGRMLWHNGIIKQKYLNEDTWDTAWLLRHIINHGFKFLSEVDGTFACVLYDDDSIYVFRNEISPLFIDRELSISSTKFDGSQDLSPNKVFRLDLKQKSIDEIYRFRTRQNPYFLGVF